MEFFIAAIIVMSALSIATFQLVQTVKYRELAEQRQKMMYVLLYMNAVLVVSTLLAGGESVGMMLTLDVMLAVVPASLLASSLWGWARAKGVVYLSLIVQMILFVYYLSCALSVVPSPSSAVLFWAMILISSVYVVLFILGIWFLVREVRAVMMAGNVWSYLSFMVDTVYLLLVISEMFVVILFGKENPILLAVLNVMITGACAGYALRIAGDSIFVVLARHERRIIESMKISSVDTNNMSTRERDVYKEIYERILDYFEREKPFLNGDLTINDIVSVVYSNKLYISRAISQNTGRNFCQFVNYHRIMYSVECFRRNPDLKVIELWPMCGFNSIVSYNMAFRLFMGETPSDWCRKEKVRLSRMTK